MFNGFIEHSTFQLFGELLDYPKPGLCAMAREAEALVAARNPDAARLLAAFAEFAAETPLGQLEEIYTGVFELNAQCHPYVGYQLFGETYKRSVFLLGLKERYAAQGFAVEHELPDHLVPMLRFLSVCDAPEVIDELVRDALAPAIAKMVGAPAENEPLEEEPPAQQRGRAGYQQLLRALQLALETMPQAMVAA